MGNEPRNGHGCRNEPRNGHGWRNEPRNGKCSLPTSSILQNLKLIVQTLLFLSFCVSKHCFFHHLNPTILIERCDYVFRWVYYFHFLHTSTRQLFQSLHSLFLCNTHEFETFLLFITYINLE